jgi:hypothetical protein
MPDKEERKDTWDLQARGHRTGFGAHPASYPVKAVGSLPDGTVAWE